MTVHKLLTDGQSGASIADSVVRFGNILQFAYVEADIIKLGERKKSPRYET